ncbi:MaoC family dehydratase N-terminal domain-containing protein [Actinocorallia sp. A-T 12471]|uniref:FAS1-like dehydratase domain-containing protein n=1 Tax=Actinocorallia sp. A-T 12471 TaxID=3089813 RepID=UPI0029D187E8|nr:MaoC family dehydratase N-terminal domain-containing protein [Actinocorallia sp. A-T 12471]MDX6742168.1 MaoC family dehydratase N-terminal domain-containing protein [Actinocorallia sp. A-T 12471]
MSESEPSLIRPDMLEIVGRPYRRQVSYPVGASDIRRWAAAVYFPAAPPERYTDPRAERDLVAPLDFNPFAWGSAEVAGTGVEIDLDASYRSSGAMEHFLGVTPPELKRALNGGVSADYTGVPIRPGDIITSASAVSGYSQRTGRLGPMLMTDVATTWTNQDGAEVKTQRMTLIRY